MLRHHHTFTLPTYLPLPPFFLSPGVSQDDRVALLFAFRKVALRLTSRLYDGSGATLEGLAFENLFDLAVDAARADLVAHTAVFALLLDVFEGLTLGDCSRVFGWFEANAATIADPDFLKAGKLSLLRMSNEMLRRLSKADNTVFCGRILMFLASVFPLSERSGVNLKSLVNTANATHFDDGGSDHGGSDAGSGDGGEVGGDSADDSDLDDGDDAKELAEGGDADGEQAEGQDKARKAKKKKGNKSATDIELSTTRKANDPPVDFKFYRSLWGLQGYFQATSSVLAGGGGEGGSGGEGDQAGWPAFVSTVETVLKAFEANAFHAADNATYRERGSAASSPDGTSPFYFPKFLTGTNLLSLQLDDPYFRRHILVQLLVLFQALRTTSSASAEPPALTEDQAAVLVRLSRKVRKQLDATPPDGPEFARCIYAVLDREKNWITWKREKCPPYEIEATATVQGPGSGSRKRLRGDDLPEAKRQRMGTASHELARLWQHADNSLAALEEGHKAPSAESRIRAFEEEANPIFDDDPDMKSSNDRLYMFRTFRLLARTKFGAFQAAASQGVAKAVEIYRGTGDGSGADGGGAGDGDVADMETGGGGGGGGGEAGGEAGEDGEVLDDDDDIEDMDAAVADVSVPGNGDDNNNDEGDDDDDDDDDVVDPELEAAA